MTAVEPTVQLTSGELTTEELTAGQLATGQPTALMADRYQRATDWHRQEPKTI